MTHLGYAAQSNESATKFRESQGSDPPSTHATIPSDRISIVTGISTILVPESLKFDGETFDRRDPAHTMNAIIVAAGFLLVAHATPPAGWQTCGGLPDAYNNTACPASQSCAQQGWEPSSGSWGCCPFPNGVSCGKYTCCPQGTECVNSGTTWSTVSTCVAPGESPAPIPQFPYVIGSRGTTGDQVCKLPYSSKTYSLWLTQVCKTGPPLPYSNSLKNVLIVGDSGRH